MITPLSKPSLPTLAAAAAAVLCLASPARPDEPGSPARPLRALLVTGGCCHDYKEQKVIVPNGLSARVKVEWTVAHEGDARDHRHSLYQNPAWADGFDVVV